MAKPAERAAPPPTPAGLFDTEGKSKVSCLVCQGNNFYVFQPSQAFLLVFKCRLSLHIEDSVKGQE